MKIYFPKPVKLNLTIFFLLTAAAVIIYSCRRDNKSNSPAAGSVAQAKAWYESAYPALTTNNGSLITQSTGGTHDISQWVKPDWLHTASYVRLGKNVIEMPIDPNSRFGSTLKIGTKLLNKTYSRSYFLLLNDGKNYEAYIFTILADSDYINNDFSKLAHNTYRKLDANFSGKLLYFTPKGAYLGGYGYKNGQLLAPPTSQQTGTRQVQSVNAGTKKPDNIVQECTEWYIAYYEDGVFQYADYLTTTCHDVDDGSDGGSNSPPPPPPCPAGSHPGPPVTPPCIPALNPETVNSGHLTTNNLVPPPPPPDGGAPPPPSQTPCSVDGPAKPCPPDTVPKPDPCAQKADVSAQAANAIIAAQNANILANTSADGTEYGANQNLTSLTGSTYVNTPVTTNGGTNTWTVGFSWDSTNGYTVGFSHGHPEGYGPSPADVYALFSPINNQLRNSAANKQIYEAKASVTTMTSTGSYVVTISNWAALNTIFANSYSDATQQAAFESNYQSIASTYRFNNPGATYGDAGAAALIQLFPGVINVYYAPPSSTTYTPITTASTSIKTISNIPCPQ